MHLTESEAGLILELCYGLQKQPSDPFKDKAVANIADEVEAIIAKRYPFDGTRKRREAVIGFNRRRQKLESETKVEQMKAVIMEAEKSLQEMGKSSDQRAKEIGYRAVLNGAVEQLEQIAGRKRKADEISGDVKDEIVLN